MTIDERRQLIAMMRDQGVREFTLGDMHVRFDDEAPEADTQRETLQTVKPIRRPVPGLVPRDPTSA